MGFFGGDFGPGKPALIQFGKKHPHHCSFVTRGIGTGRRYELRSEREEFLSMVVEPLQGYHSMLPTRVLFRMLPS